MFVGVALMLSFMMSSDTVEMINQFPEHVSCFSLSFRGDVVYIDSDRCVIQWNVVTNAVVRIVGYSSLIYFPFSQLD